MIHFNLVSIIKLIQFAKTGSNPAGFIVYCQQETLNFSPPYKIKKS